MRQKYRTESKKEGFDYEAHVIMLDSKNIAGTSLFIKIYSK